MQETMMTTQAETTTEGADASTPAVVEGATAAPEDSQQQQAAEGATSTEAPAEAEKPQGAPEVYEFADIEGVQVADSVKASFSEVAKELDMPQEAAQKVLSKMAPAIQAHQTAQLEAMRSEWANAATTDTEFGGEKLQENLSVAKKALDTFGTPELKKLLNESGLGNHPEIIRAFYRAGKATSEDQFVSGVSASRGASDARRLYSASNMNP